MVNISFQTLRKNNKNYNNCTYNFLLLCALHCRARSPDSWGFKTRFLFYLIRSGHFLETVRTCGGKKIIYDFLCPGQSSRAPAQCQGNVDEPTSADSFLPFFFFNRPADGFLCTQTPSGTLYPCSKNDHLSSSS